MREKTIKLYEFDELSDEAKEKAIENAQSSFDYLSHDDNKAVIEWFKKTFPVNIKNWEYGGYRGSQITWEFYADQDIDELSGWRLATYFWNNHKTDLYKGKYYSTSGYYDENKKYHYKFRYSNIILTENCPTGLWLGYEILKPIFDFMKNPNDSTFWDIMNDCLHEWVFACDKDVEGFYSDENIAELLSINNYEFDENGKIQWN